MKSAQNVIERIQQCGHLGGKQMSAIVAIVHRHNGETPDTADAIWDRAAHHDLGHLFYLFKDAEMWMSVHGNDLKPEEIDQLMEIVT